MGCGFYKSHPGLLQALQLRRLKAMTFSNIDMLPWEREISFKPIKKNW